MPETPSPLRAALGDAHEAVAQLMDGVVTSDPEKLRGCGLRLIDAWKALRAEVSAVEARLAELETERDGAVLGGETLERLARECAAAQKVAEQLAENSALSARRYEALRPEVRAFAAAMERKLAKHDATRGQSWKNDDPRDLCDRINDEFEELRREVGRVAEDARVLSEAADVANFAMMVADAYGALADALGTEGA